MKNAPESNTWWLSFLLFENDGITRLLSDVIAAFTMREYSISRSQLDGGLLRVNQFKEILAAAEQVHAHAFNELVLENVIPKKRSLISDMRISVYPAPTSTEWRAVPLRISRRDANYAKIRQWELREIDTRNTAPGMVPSELCAIIEVTPGGEPDVIRMFEGVIRSRTSGKLVGGLWRCTESWKSNPVAQFAFSEAIPITKNNIRMASGALYCGEHAIAPACFVVSVSEERCRTLKSWERIEIARLDSGIVGRLKTPLEDVQILKVPALEDMLIRRTQFESRSPLFEESKGDVMCSNTVMHTVEHGRLLRASGLERRIADEDQVGSTIPSSVCRLLNIDAEKMIEWVDNAAFFKLLAETTDRLIMELGRSGAKRGVLNACTQALAMLGVRTDICSAVEAAAVRQIGFSHLGEEVFIG